MTPTIIFHFFGSTKSIKVDSSSYFSAIMNSPKEVIQGKGDQVLWYEFGESPAMRYLQFKPLVEFCITHISYLQH